MHHNPGIVPKNRQQHNRELLPRNLQLPSNQRAKQRRAGRERNIHPRLRNLNIVLLHSTNHQQHGGNNNTGQPGSNGTSGPPGNSTSSTCSISLSPSSYSITKPGKYTISFSAELVGNDCPTGGTWQWIGGDAGYVVYYKYGNGQSTGSWGSISWGSGIQCNGGPYSGDGSSGSYTITCTNSTS